ncbi:hypothetical protein [Armatimonas sp.]|uniref:hypothetical protein n=1 Tax=Armatimonas sp. TaxID=1872638 RepID=UPI003751CE6D
MNSKQLDNETLADFQELSEVLQLLHRLPQREPVLDVWPELEPKLVQFQLEERMGIFARWRFRCARFLSNFAFGAILFTQAVALNTETKMRRYVMPEAVSSGGEG